MAQSHHEEQEHLASISPVTLGSLWGIRPTIYVPIIWLLLFLAVISVVLGLPSAVLSPGTQVRIDSTPSGAAVLINNTYKGATPYTEVLPKGTYTITVSLPSFTTHEEKVSTRNIRILRKASFRTQKIHALLALEKPENFVKKSTEELASWNMVGGDKLQYFVPDTLSTSLASLKSLKQHHQTTGNASALARIETTQRKLVRAALPYSNTAALQTTEPSPTLLFMRNELAGDLAVQAYTRLMQEPTKNPSPIALSGASTYADVPTSTPRLLISGASFLHVPRTTLNYGIQNTKTASGKTRLFLETEEALEAITDNTNSAPAFAVTVPAFYIMSGEVTQAQYQRFLQETSWNGKAQVSPDHASVYLQGFAPQAEPTMPMRFISYYDALKFTQWFDRQVAPLGYSAILPNEYQWRAAALKHVQTSHILGLPDEDQAVRSAYATQASKPNFIGGLWEFTSSWYAPLPQFADFEGPQYGSEKVILGGSYISKNQTVQTRGIQQSMTRTRNASMPPAWVSPYVGFRIALVPRQ